MTDEAADCPHRQELEHTLLHCQTQSEILQATRDNYLSIIDEFKRDLEELTEQVELEQQHHPESEHYSELEEPPRINNELEIQNQRMACQISRLQEKLVDRDAQVTQLQEMIHGYSDFSENQRLKEEIYSLKQAHSAQLHKLREMASLLKNREELRAELCKEHKELEGTYEAQCKELKTSKKRQQCLEESVCQGEKVLREVTTERNLLREEITALKEKEAKAAGRERALCDQLKISQKELTNSRRVIQTLQDHVKQGQQKHREVVEQLEVANITLNQQIREFEGECKQMRGKLKQQADVNQKQEEIISSFRQWKDAQIRMDEARRRCEKRAEEHIQLLIEDNHSLVHEYRVLHQDYSILENEMQRVKQAVHRSTAPQTLSPQPDCARVVPQMADDHMSTRMRILAQTSQRLAAQSKRLLDHSSPQNPPSLGKGAQQEQAAALSSQESPSLSRNTQSADSPLWEQPPNP